MKCLAPNKNPTMVVHSISSLLESAATLRTPEHHQSNAITSFLDFSLSTA